MTDELERIWKEAIVAYWRYYPYSSPEGYHGRLQSE
jgi:hypothetical protein